MVKAGGQAQTLTFYSQSQGSYVQPTGLLLAFELKCGEHLSICNNNRFDLGHLLASGAAFHYFAHMLSHFRPIVSGHLESVERSFDSSMTYLCIMEGANDAPLVGRNLRILLFQFYDHNFISYLVSRHRSAEGIGNNVIDAGNMLHLYVIILDGLEPS